MVTGPAPEIAVLYLDEALVAVSKPGGMLVHRNREAPDREVLLQQLRDQISNYLYPVHRLDRAASGVILFALSTDDARNLQKSLNAPDASKEYLALVRGAAPEEFTSERPLTSDSGVAQAARTSFRTVAEFARCSLVQARLHSGRRHQIRRHLHHCAHQVIGDTTYGKGRINRSLREEYGLPRLCLHAHEIEIDHPRTGERLRIRAPLATDLREFFKRLPDAPADLIDSL